MRQEILRLSAFVVFRGQTFFTVNNFLSDDVIPMTSSVNVGKRKSDGIFGVTMRGLLHELN